MADEPSSVHSISSYVLLGDLRTHYLIWDEGWQGRPIVLLHGLASNARIWDLTAPHLLNGGLFPVAPDQRGHGRTDKPDGNYDFDVFVRDLAAFLDACNIERPILVGHSWGAMVAMDYASRVRVGLRSPAGLVMVDGGMNQLSEAPGATWEETRDRLTPPKLAGMPLAEFTEMVRRGGPGWIPGEDAMQIIVANFAVSADETIAPHLAFENHMKIVRAMWDFQTFEKFAQVNCPVMAVPARPPHAVGPAAEFLAVKERGLARLQQIKSDVRTAWMDKTVHDIPLQRPARLADLLLDFSQRL